MASVGREGCRRREESGRELTTMEGRGGPARAVPPRRELVAVGMGRQEARTPPPELEPSLAARSGGSRRRRRRGPTRPPRQGAARPCSPRRGRRIEKEERRVTYHERVG